MCKEMNMFSKKGKDFSVLPIYSQNAHEDPGKVGYRWICKVSYPNCGVFVTQILKTRENSYQQIQSLNSLEEQFERSF